MTDDDRTNADYGRLIREMLAREHPLEAKQTRDLPEISIEPLQTERYTDSDAREQLLQTLSQRREYKLRGAWRAGYDYVHVYRQPEPPLGRRELVGEFRVTPDALLPSNDEQPPDGPGRYLYTYDLTSVPDAVVRQAIRGDLD